MRREIPLAITAITGIIMIVVFFIPVWEDWRQILLNWFNVIAGFALVLGVGSLLLVNLNKISRKTKGWGYSVVLIVGLFAMTLFGVFEDNIKSFSGPSKFGRHSFKDSKLLILRIQNAGNPFSSYVKEQLSPETKAMIEQENLEAGEAKPSKKLENALSGDLNRLMAGGSIYEKSRFMDIKLSEKVWGLIEMPDKKSIDVQRMNRLLIEEAYPLEIIKEQVRSPFEFLFEYVYTPLSATMFCLLAFYIASAAFRAFKAKTIEAGLLLITAFFVMLGRVPIGEIIWNHIPILNSLSLSKIIEDWVMGCFNTAGQRAIMLGASIGIISVSMKILLGVERSYLGGGE